MKQKLILSLILIIIILVSTGCAFSSGTAKIQNQSNQKLSQKLIKNKTTKNQVLQIFGKPTNKVINQNGNLEYIYQYNVLHNHFISFVPLIDFFVQGQNQINKKLIILFHKNGTIKNWTWLNSNTPRGFINLFTG